MKERSYLSVETNIDDKILIDNIVFNEENPTRSPKSTEKISMTKNLTLPQGKLGVILEFASIEDGVGIGLKIIEWDVPVTEV